jgi:phosphoserine phosphatase RsbU/P
MNNRYNKLNAFKLLVLVLTIFAFILSGFNIYKFAISPTDENVFSEPPTLFYIVNDIPVNAKDTIKQGNFLISVNNIAPKGMTHLSKILDGISDSVTINLIVFDMKKFQNMELKPVSMYRIIKKNISSIQFKYLSSAVFVRQVIPNGASDKAGMKAGDIITKINGKSFADMYEADTYMQSSSSGSTVDYEILRGSYVFNLKLILAKFGLDFVSLTLFLGGILYMLFGFYIAYNKVNLIAARILGLSMLLIGFFVSVLPYRPVFSFDISNNLTMIVSSAARIFGFAVMFHSFYYFPREIPELIAKKIHLVITYTLSIILFIVSTYSYLKVSLMGLFTISNQVWIVGIIIYINVLNFVYRKNIPKEYKKALRPLLVASIIFVLAYLSRYFMQYVMGVVFSEWLLASLVFLPAYVYIILHYRLLGLEFRIRRNIQYHFISIAWKISLILILIALIWNIAKLDIYIPNIKLTIGYIQVLEKPLEESMRFAYQKLLLVLISLTLVVILVKTGRSGQKYIDRKFHRQKYNFHKSVGDLSIMISKTFNLRQLTESVTEKVAAILHLKRLGLVVMNSSNSVNVQQYHGFKSQELEELMGNGAAFFLNNLQAFHGEISTDYINEPYKSVFRDYHFSYIYPLRNNVRTLGVLLLGEKMSESSYNRDDFEFLNSLTSQLAIAVDNSLLHEELTEQERIKHELLIAREIQLASLPQTIPFVEGLDISSISVPALEVGGDFYDFLEVKNSRNRITVVIGDVSGKGTSAALYMSKVQGIIKTLNEFKLLPKELMRRTNNLLYNKIEKKSFVSALAIYFDLTEKYMISVRAGHLPIYYYCKSDGKVVKIHSKGIVLGVGDDFTFSEHTHEIKSNINSGDILLLITDGVTESMDQNNDEFGEKRLMDLFFELRFKNAEEIKNQITDSVKNYSYTKNQSDDMTVVVIRIL